jgi:hypothetical protein
MMELELFTDLIDTLGKVAGGLKAIVNLPKAEREAMRRTLDETHHVMIAIRPNRDVGHHLHDGPPAV